MKRMRGFTLIELIVTVAVIGILAAVAIPSFRSAALRNRASSEANSFLSVLTLARNEAIKRNTQVVICKTINGSACSTATADSWDQGVLIFVDNGAGGGAANDETRNGAEEILRTDFPFSTGSRISGNGPFTGAVIYRSDGRVYDTTGSRIGVPNASIRITPGDEDRYGKSVLINVNGRPRIV